MTYSAISITDRLSIDLTKSNGLGVLVSCDSGNLPTDNDAAAMRETLEYLKYDIITLQNEDATMIKVQEMLRKVNEYLQVYKGTSTMNDDGSRKAIIFAFAGHGGSVCSECDKFRNEEENRCKCVDKSKITKEDAILLHDGVLRIHSMIVNEFLVRSVTHIPKLFFFDCCRGVGTISRACPPRSVSYKEVNYRLDFATIPGHLAPGEDQWMILTARYLREKDWSFGDIMDEVRMKIYEGSNKSKPNVQMPETLNRLTTGPLYLKPRT